MNSKSELQTELRSFERRIASALMFRGALLWAGSWFFFWGVVVLVGRFTSSVRYDWLVLGLLGFLPLAAVGAIQEWKKRPPFPIIRASFDGLNRCGGLLMAEEVADTSAWQSELNPASAPKLHWRSGKILGLFGASAAFVALALILPDRLAQLGGRRPLEIGTLVEELKAQVDVLQEEKILEENKAIELKEQLAQLKQDSSATDPNKTWEALDHIKEANSALAQQAAEEALAKMAKATDAETMAATLEMAGAEGLDEAKATQAAQDLAGLLRAARLDEGLVKMELPADLLKKLETGLDAATLKKVLEALKAGKLELSATLQSLSNLKMLDPSQLRQLGQGSGQGNSAGLAAFLAAMGTNGLVAMDGLGAGGPGGGGGHAPMTLNDPLSPEGFKFKEEVLPPANQISDSQTIGVSRSAPQQTGDEVVANSGALASAKTGGGSAYTQVVLPKHKDAVQKFFKRDP